MAVTNPFSLVETAADQIVDEVSPIGNFFRQ